MPHANQPALFNLDGKRALLTGASGFLGRHMAAALLEHGADVVIMGQSDRLLSQRDELAATYGARVSARQIDMYDAAAYDAALTSVASEPVDILVNNAFDFSERTGFNSPRGQFGESTREQWLNCFTSGIWWAAASSQVIGSQMRARHAGSIINVSTMYAVVAPDPALYEGTKYLNPPGYSAAKAGMLAMTRYAASFLGPYQVRANAILPGPFSNVGGGSYNAVKADDEFLDRLRARTALKRLGHPRELAGALIFLASDASSYVTGQAIIVDGGWTIS